MTTLDLNKYNIHEGYLILIDKEHPLRWDYHLKRQTISCLSKMMNDLIEKGQTVPTYTYQTSTIEGGLSVNLIFSQHLTESASKALRKAAPKFGLIQRYMVGKELFTGTSCLPWYFRYVGFPHSQIIARLGLCLEEYHDYIKAFPLPARSLSFQQEGRNIEISYVSGNIPAVEISDNGIFEVSGNNLDGYILTHWI